MSLLRRTKSTARLRASWSSSTRRTTAARRSCTCELRNIGLWTWLLIGSGFGSIVVSDPEEMTRCVVDAVVESGVCAILSKGWSDRGAKNKGEEKGDSEGADGVKYPDEILYATCHRLPRANADKQPH